MTTLARRAGRWLTGLSLCLFAGWVGATPVTVTDVLGRKVVIDSPATIHRIVLGEGRLAYALALLDRDNPFARVVGWQNDLRLMDPHTYAGYRQTYPQVDKIALIGQSSEETVSAEKVLALRPDLVILSTIGHGPGAHSPLVQLLEQSGIPVLFVDFRGAPLTDTVPSIRALGQALGREKEAADYIGFYQSHLDRIRKAVATLSPQDHPAVFLQLLAGVWSQPGHTAGKGNMTDFIDAAGGRSIAEGRIPGAIGDLNMEYVLEAKPDVYIATGDRAPGLVLGAGVDPAKAQQSLQQIVANPQLAALSAIKHGNAHGLWHDYYASPYNIVAVEVIAKWLHPKLFATLDPQATQRELYEHFLHGQSNGTYWIDLESK